MVKRLFGGKPQTDTRSVDSARGRAAIEESREIVVALDREGRVVAASRRACEALPELAVGRLLPDSALRAVEVPYDANGSRETLVYLIEPEDNAAYDELRSGFTAAVSHELRTPLARLMSLLETATLPGEDPAVLVERAKLEVEEIGGLIDDVLFLSELETGREVVALGATPIREIAEQVVADQTESAARGDIALRLDVPDGLEVPLRPRMLRVVLENLVTNAIRYAGPGARCRVSAERRDGAVVLTVADDGQGVSEEDLPRLFERFYRADRARSSRGTGLGLSIVKHVVTSAGGTVEAAGSPGGGLTVRSRFP
ncbi:MAG: HAMP domain-containing histidine kinase [Actinobacteria bacterium]|nr:HAMP domain-containing histidine kinase [Actinomycetota bacterium]